MLRSLSLHSKENMINKHNKQRRIFVTRSPYLRTFNGQHRGCEHVLSDPVLVPDTGEVGELELLQHLLRPVPQLDGERGDQGFELEQTNPSNYRNQDLAFVK